jgi:hypothetical protein
MVYNLINSINKPFVDSYTLFYCSSIFNNTLAPSLCDYYINIPLISRFALPYMLRLSINLGKYVFHRWDVKDAPKGHCSASLTQTKINITKKQYHKKTIINKNDKVLFLFIQIIFFNNNILFEYLIQHIRTTWSTMVFVRQINLLTNTLITITNFKTLTNFF